MAFTFFNRESACDKAARLDKKRSQDLARKAGWKRFWFRVKMTFLVMFLGVASCTVYFARNPPTDYRPGYQVSPPVNATPVLPKPVAKVAGETDVEKAFEKESGKEVVHKKDGTIYLRNQPKKK